MKLIGMMAIVALACASCSKQTISQSDDEKSAPAAPSAPAKPEEPPIVADTPPPATPVPAAAAPELAPEGVFYLISAARVETSAGVVGLPPGSGVKLVRPGIYQTSAGEAAIPDNQLTNDLGVARAARDAAQAEQAALRKRGLDEAAVAAQRARVKATDSQASQTAALNAIDGERLARRIADLRQQQTTAQAQLNALMAKRSKENYNTVFKGRVVTSTTEQQMTAVSAQLQALATQLAAAEQEQRAR